MSRLVHLRLDDYARDAFNSFAPTDRFTIGSARALMWMSQLAYEAYPGGNQDIIREVGSRWQFVSVTPFARDHVSLNATYDTCGVIGVRQDAVIIAFAGTDPAAARHRHPCGISGCRGRGPGGGSYGHRLDQWRRQAAVFSFQDL